MHPASAFQMADPDVLAELVRERGLALIIGTADGRPLVAHAPVLLAAGRLRFHLSVSNPLSQALLEGGDALAIVTGPDAYVSPDWYGVADQVPTWNYLSVEMAGPVHTLVGDAAIAVLDEVSAAFEVRLAPKTAWTRHKMSPGRFEAMLPGIRAFEMTLERFEGVWKLSQNKPAAAIAGVMEALASSDDPGSKAIAAAMADYATRTMSASKR